MNVSEGWMDFLQHEALIFEGPLKSKEEEGKCCYWLLIWVGVKARDISNTWINKPATGEK